jgi:hypothetical protein
MEFRWAAFSLRSDGSIETPFVGLCGEGLNSLKDASGEPLSDAFKEAIEALSDAFKPLNDECIFAILLAASTGENSLPLDGDFRKRSLRSLFGDLRRDDGREWFEPPSRPSKVSFWGGVFTEASSPSFVVTLPDVATPFFEKPTLIELAFPNKPLRPTSAERLSASDSVSFTFLKESDFLTLGGVCDAIRMLLLCIEWGPSKESWPAILCMLRTDNDFLSPPVLLFTRIEFDFASPWRKSPWTFGLLSTFVPAEDLDKNRAIVIVSLSSECIKDTLAEAESVWLVLSSCTFRRERDFLVLGRACDAFMMLLSCIEWGPSKESWSAILWMLRPDKDFCSPPVLLLTRIELDFASPRRKSPWKLGLLSKFVPAEDLDENRAIGNASLSSNWFEHDFLKDPRAEAESMWLMLSSRVRERLEKDCFVAPGREVASTVPLLLLSASEWLEENVPGDPNDAFTSILLPEFWSTRMRSDEDFLSSPVGNGCSSWLLLFCRAGDRFKDDLPSEYPVAKELRFRAECALSNLGSDCPGPLFCKRRVSGNFIRSPELEGPSSSSSGSGCIILDKRSLPESDFFMSRRGPGAFLKASWTTLDAKLSSTEDVFSMGRGLLAAAGTPIFSIEAVLRISCPLDGACNGLNLSVSVELSITAVLLEDVSRSSGCVFSAGFVGVFNKLLLDGAGVGEVSPKEMLFNRPMRSRSDEDFRIKERLCEAALSRTACDLCVWREPPLNGSSSGLLLVGLKLFERDPPPNSIALRLSLTFSDASESSSYSSSAFILAICCWYTFLLKYLRSLYFCVINAFLFVASSLDEILAS